MFGGLYTDEDDQLEDKEPTDDFTDYEEDDQGEEEEPMGPWVTSSIMKRVMMAFR
jgi:hypothetical protein